MKKITHLFAVVLLFAATLVSCDGLLDLEPQASISDQVALSTPQNVKAALIGAYDVLGGGSAYGGDYNYLTEIYAVQRTEVAWRGTYIQPREVYDKAILTDNSYIANVWTAGYNIINRTNNILSAMDVFGSDTAGRNQVEAEAKAIRAVVYFNLVQLYGKHYMDGSAASNPGVPLILTPTRTIDESLQVPRNSVGEVYDFIVTELNSAKAALPESNGFYFNRHTVSAFLARVHLAMGNYAQAAAEANNVIQSGRYSLESTFADGFNQTQNGTEVIYATQVTVTDGANDNTVFYAPTPTGRADVEVLDGHFALYEAGDVRRNMFILDAKGWMTSKFSEPRRNVVVLRLAEMILTRAEANFRLTGSAAGVGGVTPVADVNTIRSRAGLAPVASVDLPAILKERKLELMFEGVLYLDLKRTQSSTTSGTKPVVEWNANELVFPIPYREMLVNKNLTQNPGYGN